MALNEQFMLALANGDSEAKAQFEKLPTTMKMGIAWEVDRLREEKGIIPQNTGFSIYEEKPMQDRDEAVAETIKRMMDQKRQAEEERHKKHEEFVKKQVEQAIQRSRAGLPSRSQLPKVNHVGR